MSTGQLVPLAATGLPHASPGLVWRSDLGRDQTQWRARDSIIRGGGATMSRTCWLVLVAALAGGCATPEGPPYAESKATTGKPGYATLYVFRDYAEPTALAPTIHIDDKPVTDLAQKGYTWVYAKPGPRKVTAIWSGFSQQKPGRIDLDLAEANTYYLAVLGTSRFGKQPGWIFDPRTWQMGSGFVLVPPNVAEESLARCCNFHRPLQPDY